MTSPLTDMWNWHTVTVDPGRKEGSRGPIVSGPPVSVVCTVGDPRESAVLQAAVAENVSTAMLYLAPGLGAQFEIDQQVTLPDGRTGKVQAKGYYRGGGDIGAVLDHDEVLLS